MTFRKLLMTLACAACVVSATNRPAKAAASTFPPDISTTQVGTPFGDGTFLWEWDVFAGQKPALSHFVLIDLCDEVYADIVLGSLYGGTAYEFGHDPTTSADGLKFEVDMDDLDHGRFGFRTHQAWEPGLLDVAFKSGQELYFQDNVVGPHCASVVPEPGTMSLLGLGAMGLVGRPRRRRSA